MLICLLIPPPKFPTSLRAKSAHTGRFEYTELSRFLQLTLGLQFRSIWGRASWMCHFLHIFFYLLIESLEMNDR